MSALETTVAAGRGGSVAGWKAPAIGARFDGREREFLDEALGSNSLFYWPAGRMVSRMLERAKRETGAGYAVATSSGSASVHAAVAAAGVECGMEVITSPITDIGSMIGVLYQNAIPVFADVDARSYHLTAESIERVMTDRTRAVIVVHLAGAAADMDPIVELCRKRGVVLIEDCAQAFGCRYKGRAVGTIGEMGCFSFNDYKHLSTGDGGYIITNNEERFYSLHNYVDKFYDRHGLGVRLDHLAPNYRMSELQGAVGLAQFDRLNSIVEKRNRLGSRLTQRLDGVDGILTPKVIEEGVASYWFYLFRVEESKLGMSRDEFAARLREAGLPVENGYIKNPLYREPMFLRKSFFPGGVWPAELAAGRTYDYGRIRCPEAERVLETCVKLAIHQGFTDADIDYCAATIRRVAGERRG